MSTRSDSLTPRHGNALPLLPLVGGDRLTRGEFERRWEAMPDLMRAELIEGIVYMATAARYKQHGEPSGRLLLWLGAYAAATPGLEVANNVSVRLDQDNEPQPDALLRIDERRGGQSRVAADGFLEGAPELVAEVAASSTSIDLHTKLHVYRRHGVREYVVWRVLDEAIDWFALRSGQYVPLIPNEQQIYHSELYPGLWLDAAALERGDSLEVLKTLQQGLSTDQHAAFQQRLTAWQA